MVKTKLNRKPPMAETSSPTQARVHPTWGTGQDVAHQGDLTIVCLASLPKSAKPRGNRQLADGTTAGSRHVLIGGSVFDADVIECAAMIRRMTGREVDAKYIGPVFSGSCTIEHPQHQHQTFPDHAASVIVYQRNLDAEERDMRALD